MTSRIKSYTEQSLHYFTRPDEGVLEDPPKSASTWLGDELAAEDARRFRSDPAAIEELDAALALAEATGKPTQALSAADFPLPSLAPEIERWRGQLASGRGLQVLSGIPVER